MGRNVSKKFVYLQNCATFAIANPREFSSAGSEHLPYKQRVGGSNPSTPTNEKQSDGLLFFVCGSILPSNIDIPSPTPPFVKGRGYKFNKQSDGLLFLGS